MKHSTALPLICIIVVSILISAQPTWASNQPAVGVKEGDWAEYNVILTGNPPAVHRGLVWMRIEILEVEGAAFPANVSLRFDNGSYSSDIWQFNFTSGNTEGWLIIPPNLQVGDTFYDNFSKTDKNVAVQGEKQQVVLGASRTVTYSNDSYRHKEWDQTTGVFVGSIEVLKNWTATVEITATNLWSPQILGLDQNVFYTVVAAAAVVAMAAVASVVLLVKRKNGRQPLVASSLKRKLAAVAVVLVVVAIIGAVAATPLKESQAPLSFRDINLLMQTLWTSLVLTSMWFRRRGNYFVHEVIMVVVVSATLVSFSSVLLMSPMDSGSMDQYFGSPLDITVFAAHGIFSIPAIFFGVWLVTLWRHGSEAFPAKSSRVAKLTWIFWVISYIVGVLDFLLIRGGLG